MAGTSDFLRLAPGCHLPSLFEVPVASPTAGLPSRANLLWRHLGPCLQAQAELARRPAARDALAAYIDTQLASVGGLDRRFSTLRSCTVTLLRLGRGTASEGGPSAPGNEGGNGGGGRARQEQQEGVDGRPGSGQLFPSVRRLVQQSQQALARLQEAQAATAAAEVRLMGGSVAPALTNPVTHVVGISLPQQEAVAGPDGGRVLRPASVAPEAVLRAVAQQQRGGGTAVATLHLGLGSGNVRLVSDRCASGIKLKNRCNLACTSGSHSGWTLPKGMEARRAGSGWQMSIRHRQRLDTFLSQVAPCSWVHACLGRAEGGAAGLPPEDGGHAGGLGLCVSMHVPAAKCVQPAARPLPTDPRSLCTHKSPILFCSAFAPAGFPLAPTDPGSLQAWPWQLYPAEPATSHRGQAGRPHGAGATAGSPPVSYPAGPAGRRRGTAANATRTAASRRRAPARPAAAAGAAAAAKEEAASSLKQEASEGSAEEAQAAPGQRFGRFGRRSGAATRRGGTAVRAASREAPAPAAAAAPAPPAVDSVPAHGGMVPEPQEPEGPGASSLQQEQAATPAPTYQASKACASAACMQLCCPSFSMPCLYVALLMFMC